jgi:hypothetical protein
MFVADGKVIPVDAPFELNGIQFPANWLRLSTEEEKLTVGISWKPDPEPVDQRFYWDSGIPKDIKDLKTQWIAQQKQTASTLLAPTDWYVTRQIETSLEVPTPISEYRSEVRWICSEREKQIASCKKTSDLANLVTGNELTEWPMPLGGLV